MARNSAGSRDGLVRCEACGEEYSATYRRCPFCGGKGQGASQEDSYVFEGGSVFDELDREREQARGEAPEQPRDTSRDTSRVPSSRGGKRLATDPAGGSPSRSGGGNRSRSGGSRAAGKGPGSRASGKSGGSSQRGGASGSRGAASGSRGGGGSRSAGGAPRDAGEAPSSRDTSPPRGGGSGRSAGGSPRDAGEAPSSRDTSPPRGGGSGGPPPAGGPPQRSEGPARRRRGSRARRRQSAIREFWDRSGLTPTRIVGFFITLAIIIVVFLLITRLILPMIGRGTVDTPDNSKDPGQSQTADPSPSGSSSPDPSPSGSGGPDDSPAPTGDQIPADQTATGFTLNRSEFAFSDQWPNPVTLEVTFIPAGSTGTISWSSSDESIVTVDENGTVSPVGRGTATITATLPGGVTQTCKVYNNMTTGAAPAPSPSDEPDDSPAPSGGTGSLTLSREDFTLNDTWPSYTFTVTGASGTVTWRSSNASVATVDANGKVTKVGSGTCTITATDAAGNTATCIVRCS